MITARTSEGTKINIESMIQCQIAANSSNLKQFLEEYGFDDYDGAGQIRWMTYLNQYLFYHLEKLKTSLFRSWLHSSFTN